MRKGEYRKNNIWMFLKICQRSKLLRVYQRSNPCVRNKLCGFKQNFQKLISPRINMLWKRLNYLRCAKLGTCRIIKQHRLLPGRMHLIDKRVAPSRSYTNFFHACNLMIGGGKRFWWASGRRFFPLACLSLSRVSRALYFSCACFAG